MRKNFILLISFLFVFLGNTTAQQLRFHKDGTFKIAQFTDTHIVSTNPESLDAIRLISETLDKENPDLVIFTGDVVTGKPASKGWEMALEPVLKKGVPYCVVLGNHDAEQDLSRREIAEIVTSNARNLNKRVNKQLADVVLEVKSANSNKPSALLYCMDSNDYSKIDTIKGYGWFSFEQIQWYRQQSVKFTKRNDGKPLPALAFFHIALPEYKCAYDNKQNIPIGIRLEDECCPKTNSGMFTAMIECGGVMGTFVGHDHDNDYLASLYGIALGYGRFSGGKTTYTHIPNGSRIITLKEGERGFTTFVRLLDGQKIEQVTFPGSFK